MVKFKSKLINNKSTDLKSINIPKYIFKNNLLEYKKGKEYWVEITEIEDSGNSN